MKIEGFHLEEKKLAALRCHATQVEETSPFFQMAKVVGPKALGVEYFRIVQGQAVKDGEFETDIFAGI